VDAAGDLGDQRRGFGWGEGEGSGLDECLEVAAGDVLIDDVGFAGRGHAAIEDGGDVVVRDSAGLAGFGDKAGAIGGAA
jgi:hypothetical protein